MSDLYYFQSMIATFMSASSKCYQSVKRRFKNLFLSKTGNARNIQLTNNSSSRSNCNCSIVRLLTQLFWRCNKHRKGVTNFRHIRHTFSKHTHTHTRTHTHTLSLMANLGAQSVNRRQIISVGKNPNFSLGKYSLR